MTLHAAIEKLLKKTGHSMTTGEIADELNKNDWYQKKDNSKITDFQIHGRTRNYPQFFNRSGTTVSLTGQEIGVQEKQNTILKDIANSSVTTTKDEHYVLEICDTLLNCTSLRQHRFDFLVGDSNANGFAVRLPVDAYYEKFKLVIEYRERQHTESVPFFDKPNSVTVSGVHRGKQRKIYDDRRRMLIPQNSLTLIEISYSDFYYDSRKRIMRNKTQDIEIVRNILHAFMTL